MIDGFLNLGLNHRFINIEYKIAKSWLVENYVLIMLFKIYVETCKFQYEYAHSSLDHQKKEQTVIFTSEYLQIGCLMNVFSIF